MSFSYVCAQLFMYMYTLLVLFLWATLPNTYALKEFSTKKRLRMSTTEWDSAMFRNMGYGARQTDLGSSSGSTHQLWNHGPVTESLSLFFSSLKCSFSAFVHIMYLIQYLAIINSGFKK